MDGRPSNNMSRLERAFWSIVYFATGVGLALAAVQALDGTRAQSVRNIVVFAVASFWLGAWRQFRNRIVRDLGWGVRIAFGYLRIGVHGPMWSIIRRFAPAIRLHELDVYILAESPEQRASRQRKLSQAFELIRTLWPSRYARLQRLAPSVYVGIMRPAGMFTPRSNVIGVQEGFVDARQPEAIAAVICHELMHAYIDSRGVLYTPWIETRAELLCNGEIHRWTQRLIRGHHITPQVSAELVAILEHLHKRWWWREDGTRVHGTTFETPVQDGSRTE